METFYLIVVIVLFILAISDLVVGVSNDAVNFLNSAVGAKAGSFKLILTVAALGILFGCTFSGGMMEVARKGIFHPEYFYFSEIILLFLAVMVTDIILLDTFNTFGMPTSTTVSIVFELLGAAVAFSLIKIYTDVDALTLGEYINSAKALAIISGILLSVVVAFTAGAVVQYLTRMLFSFNYEKSLKYFGSLWGGLAIAAITYFILIKGAKGASFMDDSMKEMVNNNALMIISGSFVFWTIFLQLAHSLFKFNILKFIVMVGTFALAMAFAGNDLVNFIGVPLAGYNSYELYMATDGIAPNEYLMDGLAGKIKTPTMLLIIAGIIMAITLWTSKKARSVIKTSLDLGRQYEGSERFTANTVSRSLVRNFSKMAGFVNSLYPKRISNYVDSRFDESSFVVKQKKLGKEAPSFDMIRASSTLVVASILIAIGTSLKLPLSTTYVTFMVFMGTSLADGAWGRESAVFRVSGVMTVVGGWFFTAFSAFTVAFIIANIFHFGGPIAILAVILLVGVVIYRTHRYHAERTQEQIEFELSLDEGHLKKDQILELSSKFLNKYLGGIIQNIDDTLDGLEGEKLKKLSKTFQSSKSMLAKSYKLRSKANNTLENIDDEDIDIAHLFILSVDYIYEMVNSADHIIKPSYVHVDNNHKPLLKSQIDELREVQSILNSKLKSTIALYDPNVLVDSTQLLEGMEEFLEMVRVIRKKQIKRIKSHEIGTRNSLLFLNHLAELRNLGWYSSRLIMMYKDLVIAENNGGKEDKTS